MSSDIKKKIEAPLRGIRSLLGFLREVIAEIKKVDWPKLKEAIRYSLIVIGGSVFFAVFLGGVDSLFSLFLNRFILQ